MITQCAADVEALTQQPGLLASLTDNFTGVVAHRQTSPESRDWLAKLMGTRALWQSTNQTASHGTQHSGRGSAPGACASFGSARTRSASCAAAKR